LSVFCKILQFVAILQQEIKEYNMRKTILIAALFAASANAAVTVTGDYEGTFTDGHGATFAQDLDLTMVGSTDGASVTVMMEDLTGGSTVTANQVFVEAGVEGLNFKGGNYKSLNGSGILQKSGAVTNQFSLGTTIAGAGVSVNQVSGAAEQTVDASLEYQGVAVDVQDVSATDRFITAAFDFFGFGMTVETQNTAVGRNTGVTAGFGVEGIDVTGVYIDVKDAAGVTQDDGLVGDISSVATDVKAGVASMDTVAGKVTGKYIVKDDKNTYVGELERGVWTVGYTKDEDVDGVFDAKLNVSF